MGKIVTGVLKPFAVVTWAGKNITAELSRYVGSITYVDVLDSDKVGTDTVTLTLNNNDGRFFDSWYPEQGDTLECGIGWYDDKGHRSSWIWGKFTIDDIRFQLNPNRVAIGANAKPVTRGQIDNAKNVVYENTSFINLAKEAAKETGLDVFISPSVTDVPFARVQQRDESKLALLGRYAKESTTPIAIKAQTLVVGEVNQDELTIDILNRDVLTNASFPVSARSKYDGIRVWYYDPVAQSYGEYSVGNVQDGAKIKELRYEDITTLEEAQAFANNYMATGSGDNSRQVAKGRITLVNTTVTVADTIRFINAGKLPDKWKPTTVSTSLTSGGWQSTVTIARQS